MMGDYKRSKKVERLPYEILGPLLQEQRLISLLYHRNRNQHRVARWWKLFNTLKRVVSQVIRCVQTITPIEINKLYNVIHKFIRCHLKKMYYEFNGVITLGQFPTLGVVLVGHLSRIRYSFNEILVFYKDNFAKFYNNSAGSTVQKSPNNDNTTSYEDSSILSGEEIGEVIREDDIVNLIDMSELERKEDLINKDKDKKKKMKKSKKQKSAIDSIFG